MAGVKFAVDVDGEEAVFEVQQAESFAARSIFADGPIPDESALLDEIRSAAHDVALAEKALEPFKKQLKEAEAKLDRAVTRAALAETERERRRREGPSLFENGGDA